MVTACGEACTADAAAAEYLIGGKTVGTALGAGTLGTGSFDGGGCDGAEPLVDLVGGGTSPVGLCAVPSRVGFRFAVPVLVLVAVGL